ncbi:polysaccharide deacetylase family protein [Tellurirhabdus rosea]|uniref:polysaccharide deacetylase family protein n=1 Tax=Tellurirhabdus rosea TaxID=2674997 RepID=UPI00225B84A0|nr:polysaccharide deacetylase family protein [Tellurirhabdus rosea]
MNLWTGIGILLLLFILVLWIFYRKRPTLPVLMFHKVDPQRQDMLTVSVAQLDEQLGWLKKNGYQSVSLRQVADALNRKSPLPPRPVLLTFDDAYRNNLTHAVPLLLKHRFKATLFVPTAFVGGRNEWDGGDEPLMTADELRSLDPAIFEMALHTHRHPNFKHTSVDEIREDVAQNIATFGQLGLSFTPILAYPYGGRPKDAAVRQAMFDTLRDLGVVAAFRIGNRLNPLPLRNRYELQRLDIRGTDSLAQFIRKVRFGKLL